MNHEGLKGDIETGNTKDGKGPWYNRQAIEQIFGAHADRLETMSPRDQCLNVISRLIAAGKQAGAWYDEVLVAIRMNGRLEVDSVDPHGMWVAIRSNRRVARIAFSESGSTDHGILVTGIDEVVLIDEDGATILARAPDGEILSRRRQRSVRHLLIDVIDDEIALRIPIPKAPRRHW